MTPTTLLIDYGGVLTTDVFASFARFCTGHGLPETRFADALREEPEAARLLVAMEKGELPVAQFERQLAPLLGPNVPAAGLVDRLTASLEPEPAMVAAVAALREHGVTTVMVSNSMGDGPYRGLDTDRLFDHVVLSDRVGMRKPSRGIYHHALELAGVEPAAAVFVDDLSNNCVAAERLGLRAVLHRRPADTIAALATAFAVPLVA